MYLGKQLLVCQTSDLTKEMFFLMQLIIIVAIIQSVNICLDQLQTSIGIQGMYSILIWLQV